MTQALAQGLGLAPDQLIAQLAQGQAPQDLGARHGLTPSQVHSLEVGAYQAAFQRLVAAGKMSPQDADHRLGAIQRYTPLVLDAFVTDDCLSSGNP